MRLPSKVLILQGGFLQSIQPIGFRKSEKRNPALGRVRISLFLLYGAGQESGVDKSGFRVLRRDLPRGGTEPWPLSTWWQSDDISERTGWRPACVLSDIAIEQLSLRERFGVSYPVLFDARGGRELAPVVERLAGT